MAVFLRCRKYVFSQEGNVNFYLTCFCLLLGKAFWCNQSLPRSGMCLHRYHRPVWEFFWGPPLCWAGKCHSRGTLEIRGENVNRKSPWKTETNELVINKESSSVILAYLQYRKVPDISCFPSSISSLSQTFFEQGGERLLWEWSLSACSPTSNPLTPWTKWP